MEVLALLVLVALSAIAVALMARGNAEDAARARARRPLPGWTSILHIPYAALSQRDDGTFEIAAAKPGTPGAFGFLLTTDPPGEPPAAFTRPKPFATFELKLNSIDEDVLDLAFGTSRKD